MKNNRFTVKVGETDYQFVNNMLSCVIYEQIAQKPFSTFTNLSDLLIYMYSCMAAADTETEVDILDFMSEVDEKAIEEFSKAIAPTKLEKAVEEAKKASGGKKKAKA